MAALVDQGAPEIHLSPLLHSTVLHCARVSAVETRPAFFVGVKDDPRAGPHTCLADTLPNEPSLKPGEGSS